MSTQSVVKNTAFITAASILQRIISVTYFIIVARHTNETELGWYSVALATTTMFVVLVDIGLTNVLIREAARDKEKTQTYFSNILSVKLFLGLLSYALLVLFTYLMGYEQELRWLVLLSGITMLFDSYHLSVYGVFRSMGLLRYESIGMVMSQGLTLLLGVFFLWLGYPIYFLIIAFTIASAANAVYATLMVLRQKIKVRLSYSSTVMKPLLVIAVPFALAAILNRVYSNADLLIIKKIAGNEAVAWYTTPYKVIAAFQFIPLALTSAIYPRFSESFISDKKKLAFVFEQSFLYLVILSVPMAAGIFMLAEQIILFLFGANFLPSVLPLQIIIFSIIFTFLSYPLGSLLNACDRQVTQTFFVGTVTVVNIILNIIFVWRYGIIGAAIVTLLSSVLLVILGSSVAGTLVPLWNRDIFKKVSLVIFSAIVMAAGLWLVRELLPLGISILVGAVIYGLLLLFFKVMSTAQLKEIVNLFRPTN